MDTERFVFEVVDMGRGDERYVGLADGSLGITVRRDDDRISHALLWEIADAAIKQANAAVSGGETPSAWRHS